MIIGPYVGLAALGTAIPVGRHSSFVRTDMTFSNPLQYAFVLIVTCTAQCIIMATSPCHIEVQIMHNTLCGRLTWWSGRQRTVGQAAATALDAAYRHSHAVCIATRHCGWCAFPFVDGGAVARTAWHNKSHKSTTRPNKEDCQHSLVMVVQVLVLVVLLVIVVHQVG